MTCANCGTELLPGKQFCHACGAAVKAACPRCGAEVEAAFRFCPDCGFEIGAPPHAGTAPAGVSQSMPAGLADKIRAARGVVEGERKQVTVLFCDLAGSTAVADRIDAEEYRELLDRYLALVIHEVYRFEGIVNQLAGDGLMALFGAPIAHEDAPQRAVRAALAIRDALAHFNDEVEAERGFALPARVGIHTGPVVVGTVGNDMKMDYTAIGDTTNLASRLESLAAPGTVLVSEATSRLVRGVFEMREVGPLAVKGKRKPIIAYEVLRPTGAETAMALAAARGLTPFVGRDEELAQLESCFHRLGGRLAQVVSIVGDAGAGKSRLVHEFKERLAGSDVTFFEGRCSALNQGEPYYPFVGMLRRHFGLMSGDSIEEMNRKVEARLGTPGEAVYCEYPLLCRLIAGPVGGSNGFSPEELKRQTFDAVADLVMHESRQRPVVMIVEDLHWIDEPSRELIEMAVGRLARARVMVLVSHRPDFQPHWKTTAAVTQLNLRPLPDEDLGRILQGLVGAALPAELREAILARAEGSPFFAEEITRTLLEEGTIAVDAEGVCRLTRSVEETPIPGTVQEVLAARLDRLGPPAKRVAQVAAVLGRQFARSDLEQLLAGEDLDVGRELEELERRGVIHRKSLFSAAEYRFGESLTQEVAYESLLLRQRRSLHERVGRLLETSSREGEPGRPALIAHHFALGDDRPKAVAALLRAGHEAEKLPSYRSALDFYRRAFALAEEGLDDARMRRWLAEAALGYARVTVLYGSSDDPVALHVVTRGRPIAEDLGDAELTAGLYAFEGSMLSGSRERFGEGLTLVERALKVAEQGGLGLQSVSISRALAWAYLLDGRFQLAKTKIGWVIDRLEELGEGDRLSDLYLGSLWMRGSVYFFSGDFAAALAFAHALHELSVKASNRTTESSSASAIAHGLFVRGEIAEAKRWADRSLEISEAIGSVGAIHRAAALALATRVDLGGKFNPSRYLELLDSGFHVGGNLLLSIGLVIDTLLRLGDVGRAEHFARVARANAAGRLREMLAAAALADVCVALGPARWEEAERLQAETTRLAETLGSRSTLAGLALGAGRLAALRGQTAPAEENLRRALDLSTELEMRHQAERAEEMLARLALEAPDLDAGAALSGTGR
jgi:class 3 adenylate cyclase/tetratricopeptide (TPR) repeat protein